MIRALEGKIEKMRNIKLQHSCKGLAYHDGQLYIVGQKSLYVYDMAKGQEMTLFCLQSRQGLKQTVSRMLGYPDPTCAVSPDGSRIFITDPDNNLIRTLNKDGTELNTLGHAELGCPEALHVTPTGHVFVCSYSWDVADCVHLVQVLDMNGEQTVKKLAGGIDGLTTPRSLFFNNSTNSLVVGQDDVTIVELKLK